MNADIHNILQCPVTREPLKPIQAYDMIRINEGIRQGILYYIVTEN